MTVRESSITLPQLIGLCACLGWVMLFCSPSAAEMSPIFGSKKFVRGTGKPQEFTETFQNCETAAAYKLVVLNGNSNSTNRVSSASIRLNGVEVIGPSDFNQQVARVERAISVLPSNQLQVRLASKPGSMLTVTVECTAYCLDIRITSPPSSSSTTNLSSIMVAGTVTTSSSEAGVAVNGIRAHSNAVEFAVPYLPLVEGENTITATATNSCLNTAAATVHVSAPRIEADPVSLRASPSIVGIAPLRVTFKLYPVLKHPPETITWDFEGDGVIDASGPDLLEIDTTYQKAGLYIPTASITDTQANQQTTRTVVTVFSQSAFSQELQSKWMEMHDALAQTNIEEALKFIQLERRSTYRIIFENLRDQLPTSFAALRGTLQFQEIRGPRVFFTLPVTSGGVSGELPVIFALDDDGIWRIRFF